MKKGLWKIFKKVLFISALLGVFLVTTAGTFSDEVKLKNVTKSFINLDEMVEDLPLGQGGNEESGMEGDTEAIQDSVEESDEVVELHIEVRETKIRINEEDVAGDNLQKSFEGLYKSGMRVILIDDFAEYHTFIKVQKMLEEKGIIYQETQKEK